MATAEVVIRITAEDDASKIVKRIQNTLKQIGVESKRSTDQATKAFDEFKAHLNHLKESIFNVKNIIGGLIAGFSLKKIIGDITSTAAEFERFRIQLETVMGSAKAAEEAFAWIRDFTSKTPYQLANVTEAFVRLTSRGLNAAQYLNVIAEAAAGMGKDITEAARAFTNALTGEFEMLKDFGITASVVGEQVRLSWVQNGQQMMVEIPRQQQAIADAVLKIWNERFKGGLEKFQSSWAGMWSNLQDMITEFKQTIAEAGVFDVLKEQLRSLLDTLNRLKAEGKLQEWAHQIGNTLALLIKSLWKAGEIAGRFIKILWNFKEALIGIAVAVTAYRIFQMISQIGQALVSLASAARTATVALSALSASSIIGGLLAVAAAIGAVAWAKKQLNEAFDDVINFDSIQNLAQSVTSPVERLNLLKKKIEELKSAWAAWDGYIGTVSYERFQAIRAEVEKLTGSTVEYSRELNKLWIGGKDVTEWLTLIENTLKHLNPQIAIAQQNVQSSQQTVEALTLSLEAARNKLLEHANTSVQSNVSISRLGLTIQKVHKDVSDSISVWDWMVFKMQSTKTAAEELADSLVQSIRQFTSEATSALAQSLDTSLFEQSYVTTTESLQEQIEKQKELIEELQQHKMEALAEGKEKEVENIEAALRAHEQKKAELEQQLEELRAKHESTWARIWRSFRQNVIQNMMDAASHTLMPVLSRIPATIGSAFSTLSSAVASTTPDIIAAIGSIISALGRNITAILSTAAAWIAQAAAAAVRWMVETLGPYSVVAIPAAVGGIYALWDSIKSHLGFAEGGYVWGGPGGIDNIPAFLTPGEFVLRREVVQTVGISALENLNRNPSAWGNQIVIQSPQISVIVHANMNEMSARELGQEIAASVGEALKEEIRMGITRLEELNAF